ncbi:MAG: aminotransferase class V-fold PLP-dependent enzyme [candidate division Zixibacteria bacterium]|nr:aminotransferase class V-fold PLP-dependent enzyme [candidate division Zixibacteria bacterium]
MEDLIYLDNAATAWPKPENVYRFMDQFYRKTGVNPGRSGFDMAIEAGNIIEDLRVRLTKFFGGDEDSPERLCFNYNATDALNLIIFGLLTKGDHVISTNLEHNSVIRPINHLVRDYGVEATYVPFDKLGFVDPAEIEKAIKPNTKLVIVNHGSNVIGTIQPADEIGAICKKHDIPFAIDSSQTAGVVPINMREMNIDVLAFTGHKSLLGSTGIGGMCVRKHLDIRQTRAGGTGVRSAYPYHLPEYPWRMEYGTPNMVGIASLWAGQDYIDETGMDNIYSHEIKLAEKLVAGLKQIDGVNIYCADSMEKHLSTISINIDGLDAGNVGIMLDVDYNIATRTGLQCAPLVHQQMGTLDMHGTCRFGIGAFNTEVHIDAAINAVAEIVAFVKERAVKTK